MLQIVTGMYFRTGVRLNCTVHRGVLYTNRGFLRREEIELPVGKLLPSSGFRTVSTVTVSVTEQLEAVLPDGTDDFRIASGGTELIDDLADVLSFALNAVFSCDHDLVHRLVPDSLARRGRSSTASQLRSTFDPLLIVTDAELDDVRVFITQLLALRRPAFEAAMKAIRRIVRAWQKVADDPTIAYTDIVAALESLAAEDQAVPAPTWQNVDGRKRKIIDAALEGVDEGIAGRVRQAVIEAERAGAKMRFVEFVLANVSPAFFRGEAVDAICPIRGADLRRAVRLAYDVRSNNLHSLTDLPPEAWVFGDRADTVSPPEIGTMLSLEGLSRLARHVVRSYVASAPTGTDTTFNWREAVPGQLKAELAPEYWIWAPGGLTKDMATRYLDAFIRHLLDVDSGGRQGVVNMDGVLARIETLVPGTAASPARTAMIALYALWHQRLSAEAHRDGAQTLLAKYQGVLDAPSVTAFATGLLTDRLPTWSSDQWLALATDRRNERATKSAQPLPPALDAALLVVAAEELRAAGQQDQAAQLAGWAVEEMPGNEALCAWEASVAAGQPPIEIDLRGLILGIAPEADAEPGPEAGSGIDAEPEAVPPPDGNQPQADQPQAEQPQAEQPQADQPQADQPQAEQPQADQPQADQPQADQPQADQPQADQPQAEQPQADPSETNDDGDGDGPSGAADLPPAEVEPGGAVTTRAPDS
jgi:hypothetical protein